MGRIVIYGATGYTGRLLAEALVERGRLPILAGRNPEALTELAARLGGLEIRVADSADPQTFNGLLSAGDVLATTVGPFMRFGKPALDAAVAAGAHYVDATGESAFIEQVYSRDAQSVLLPAFGYDYVPGELAGSLAVEEAPGTTRLQIGYFLEGEPANKVTSSGTKATIAEGAGRNVAVLSDGVVSKVPAASEVAKFTVGGKPRTGIVIGGGEPFSMPRNYPSLESVAAYLGWFGPASSAAPAAALVKGISKVPVIGKTLRRSMRRMMAGKTGEGPDAESRSRSRSVVVAVASDSEGNELSRVEMEGPGPYDLTAGLMSWAACGLLAGAVEKSGPMGGVEAFGLRALEEECRRLGLTRR